MTEQEKRELENDVLYWACRARAADARADAYREQWDNEKDARERAEALLEDALEQVASWKADALEAEHLVELSERTRESVDEWGSE